VLVVVDDVDLDVEPVGSRATNAAIGPLPVPDRRGRLAVDQHLRGDRRGVGVA
jgi:hypothetical protein